MKYLATRKNKSCHLLTNCMKLEYIMLTETSQERHNKKSKNKNLKSQQQKRKTNTA